jgi:hypothetical protein
MLMGVPARAAELSSPLAGCSQSKPAALSLIAEKLQSRNAAMT